MFIVLKLVVGSKNGIANWRRTYELSIKGQQLNCRVLWATQRAKRSDWNSRSVVIGGVLRTPVLWVVGGFRVYIFVGIPCTGYDDIAVRQRTKNQQKNRFSTCCGALLRGYHHVPVLEHKLSVLQHVVDGR